MSKVTAGLVPSEGCEEESTLPLQLLLASNSWCSLACGRISHLCLHLYTALSLRVSLSPPGGLAAPGMLD